MIQEKPYKIYSINCPINSEMIRYIGVTKKLLNVRLREHLLDKDRTHKTDWIKSLNRKSLIPSINLIEDDLTLEEAFKKEIEYIKLFKSCGAKLTNSGIGGEGNKGYKFTKEQKEKLSESHKGLKGFWAGKKRDMATNKKISERLKGIPMSEETKQKLSRALKGRKGKPHSIETRIKLSLIRKGKKFQPLSPEHKFKISLAKKGQVPWHKGRTNVYSEETLNKMRIARKRTFKKNKLCR